MDNQDISFYQARIKHLEAEILLFKAQQQNPECEDYLHLLFEVAFEGLVIHNNFYVVDLNAAICKLWGYERSELIGKFTLDFIAPEYHELIKQKILSDYASPYEAEGIKRDGSVFPIQVQGKTIQWRGKTLRVTAVRDLTTEKTAQAALIEGERRYQALVKAKSEAVFIHRFDVQGRSSNFIEVNDAACHSLGYSKAELLQMSPMDITPIGYKPSIEITEILKQDQCVIFEAEHRTKYGKTFPVEVRTILIAANQNLVIDFVRDISDRKAITTKLEQIAFLDHLTQVANRRQFDHHLELEWRRGRRNQSPISLIMGDIDFFKLYNDCYGHQMGDKCLQAVAKAIATTIKRPTDLVARYGGEEFGIILPNTDLAGAILISETIRTKIHELQIEHRQSHPKKHLTISLGIATMIPSATDFSILVQAADYALYQAKRSGKDQTFISPESHANAPNAIDR